MYFIRTADYFRYSVIIFVLALLPSCSDIVQPDWNPQDYTVKKGDTLYSIAWRYEKDFRDIARWNNIDSTYAIYPGQRLTMQPDSAAGTADSEDKEPLLMPSSPEFAPSVEQYPAETIRAESMIVQRGDTLYSIARREGLTHKQLARWNALQPPYSLYPGQALRLRPPAVSASRSNVITAPVQASEPELNMEKYREIVKIPINRSKKINKPLPVKVASWAWPVEGKVLSRFKPNNTANKGIVIAGNTGQAVKASAAGKVVYSGNGLISYGNLVIIKHSNTYLSAYAYNRKLLVKEGDSVSKGQTIAHMGAAESGRSQLHFEIRKNGKPVNPMKYLPKI